MKGQIVYDFIVSIVLFTLLLFTTYALLNQIIIPFFHHSPSKDLWAVSELIFLPGDPPNWKSIDEVDTFGLGKYENFWRPGALDPAKVLAMNGTSCQEISKKLGSNMEIEIKVFDKGKTYACVPSYPHNRLIIRYGSINGRVVKIEVRA